MGGDYMSFTKKNANYYKAEFYTYFLYNDESLKALIPVLEYSEVFKPIKRRWRIDFAWPDAKLAVECDGGLFSGGGHTRGAYLRDNQYPKDRYLNLQGWTVLRYLPEELLDKAIKEVNYFFTLKCLS